MSRTLSVLNVIFGLILECRAGHCGNHLFCHCVNCWFKIMQKHSLEVKLLKMIFLFHTKFGGWIVTFLSYIRKVIPHWNNIVSMVLQSNIESILLLYKSSTITIKFQWECIVPIETTLLQYCFCTRTIHFQYWTVKPLQQYCNSTKTMGGSSRCTLKDFVIHWPENGLNVVYGLIMRVCYSITEVEIIKPKTPKFYPKLTGRPTECAITESEIIEWVIWVLLERNECPGTGRAP